MNLFLATAAAAAGAASAARVSCYAFFVEIRSDSERVPKLGSGSVALDRP